jgi:origin recognition complex subunit 1
MATTTPQTPRRSKRHHPIVFAAGNSSSISKPRHDKWASPPLHTRSTITADLVDDEQSILDASTSFYSDFLRASRATDKSGKASFEKYSVGDTVLLATNLRKPSIGVIIALWEVSRPLAHSEMFANIHWFLRPTELARSRTKREHLEVRLLVPSFYIRGFISDILYQNEVYLSLDATSVVDTSVILAHCDVSSALTRSQKPSSSRYKPHDSFFCLNAVDSRRGLYYELDWHAHRGRSLERAKGDDIQWGSGSPWVVAVEPVQKRQTKSSARVNEEADTESGAGSDGEYRDEQASEHSSLDSYANLLHAAAELAEVPQTPSKKRKRPASTTSTPRRKRAAPALAAPTPHSKRALRARARRPAMRAPPPEMVGAFSLGDAPTETDPWLRAMQALHVGARPEALPCRTEEYGRVMRAVEELLEEGSGGCICELVAPLFVVNNEVISPSSPDISGVPGTGKTATVHAVVRELKRMAEENVCLSLVL